jgi:hypothetical protein
MTKSKLQRSSGYRTLAQREVQWRPLAQQILALLGLSRIQSVADLEDLVVVGAVVPDVGGSDVGGVEEDRREPRRVEGQHGGAPVLAHGGEPRVARPRQQVHDVLEEVGREGRPIRFLHPRP